MQGKTWCLARRIVAKVVFVSSIWMDHLEDKPNEEFGEGR